MDINILLLYRIAQNLQFDIKKIKYITNFLEQPILKKTNFHI